MDTWLVDTGPMVVVEQCYVIYIIRAGELNKKNQQQIKYNGCIVK